MAERPGRGSDQFALRFPAGLRDKTKSAADNAGKSMNQWLADIIEERLLMNEQQKAGWKWVEPKHQIDTGLLGELEAIEHHPEGGVPTSVSINSAISRYVAEYFGDGENEDWEAAEITSETLATKEELAALREEISERMSRIEQLLIEMTAKKS